jgi:cytochrome c
VKFVTGCLIKKIRGGDLMIPYNQNKFALHISTAGRAWRTNVLMGMVFFTGLQFSAAQAIAQAPAAVNGPVQGREWVSPAAGDVQRGAALYQARCTACHNVDSNKIGPAHRGVMGRRVGSLPGYKYSDELGRSRLRWTPQTLNAWLEDPEDLVPGQRMGFQVENAQERADLISYLATLK